MEFMICFRGDTEQQAYLSEISNLGAGIELGSYGLVGIKSWQDWKARYAKHKAIAGIEVGLENDVEKSPELLVRVVKAVNSPSLQLCLDVGHLHYLSSLAVSDWVKQMGGYLKHVHIHDNDQKADRHWPIGKGTFEFEAFYSSIETRGSNVTLSIEVEDSMEVKMNDLRKVINRFKQ
jgi:sugar phosphate isomerase/epimerase